MPILEAEGLTKIFASGDQRLTVLEGVDARVDAGESVAIVGPSGSGKSTLLSLLAGLDRPSAGRVRLFDLDLNRLSQNELSALWGRRVGFIFQSYRLLPTLTAEENVQVPLELAGAPHAERTARDWLARVGLAERRSHLPAQLSGGEQQRVALARAMAPSPEILFADEPTGNLDQRTGREMADLLFSVVASQKTTLVLVTHEPALARRAHRVIELEGGKVARDSKPAGDGFVQPS